MPEMIQAEYEIVDAGKRPRKWAAGPPLLSLEDIDEAMRKRVMLWYLGKPRHALWLGNLPYGTMRYHLRVGDIRLAVVSDDYRSWLLREAEEAGIMPAPEPAGPGASRDDEEF